MIRNEFKKLIRNRRTALILILVIVVNVLCTLYMSFNRLDKTTGLTARDLSCAFDHYVTGDAGETLEFLEEKQTAILNIWFDENGNVRQPDEELIRSLTPVTGSISKELKCLSALQSYAQQIDGYADYLKGIQRNAEEIKRSAFITVSDYTVRNIDDTAERYKTLSADNVVMYNYLGAEFVLEGSVSVFIILITSFYFCLELFVSDKYDGTLALIKTTKNSRGKLFAAKAAVLCIAAFIMFTAIYLINILVASEAFGLGNLSVRIQSVSGYYTSPWNISVGECLVFSYVTGALGTIALSLLISLLCIVSGNIIRSAGLTAGVFLVEFAAYQFIPYHSPFSLFSRINLFSIADVSSVFEDYGNINVCGYPINNLSCAIISFFIVLLSGIILGNEAWEHMRPINESHTGINLRDRKSARVRSSLGYEAKKLLTHSGGTVCVVLLLSAEVFLCVSFGTYESNSDLWYEKYSEELAGPYSAKTQAVMDDIDARFDEVRVRSAELMEQAASGEISSDYANYLIGSITPSTDQTMGHNEAKDQFEYVKRQVLSGKASEYVPVIPYENLFDRREEILCSIPLFLIISVCIPIYASMEKRYGMGPIITSTRAGLKIVLRKKRLVVIGLSFVSAVVAYAPRIIMNLQAFPVTMAGSPANSLECFGNVPNWVSIGLMLFVIAALRILTISIYSLLLFSVSRNSSRPTLIIVLSLIVSLLPCILNLCGYENDLLLLYCITGLYS